MMRAANLRRSTILVLLALHLTAAVANAQQLTRTNLSGFVHAWWKEREGLPGAAIYGITQTDDGYLWLATTTGLMRFDGHRFVRWTPFGQPDAIVGSVTGLSKSRDGSLWVGFNNGRLARIADGKPIYTPDAQSPGNVRGIRSASDGSVWVFNEPMGLRRLVKGVWQNFENDPVANRIHGVWEDSKHRIWAGTENGAALWDESRGRFEIAGAIGKEIFVMGEDSEGRIIAVSPQAFDIVDGPGRGSSVAFPQRIFPATMHVDRSDHAWVGTIGAGLYRVDLRGHRGVIEQFSKLDGLTSDVVMSIFEDREGNIWVAGSNGLNRFRERKVQSVSSLSYRNSVIGLSIRATSDGSVWVGTSDGLVRFETDGDTIAERETRLRNQTVYSIWPDGPTAPLVGLLGGQVIVHEPTSLAPRAFTVPGVTAANAIARQRSGRYWLVERSGGVISWMPAQADPPERIDTDRPANVAIVDNSDRTWVGFRDGGVTMFAESERRRYSSADGLSGSAVRAIYQDGSGTIWVGTDAGLARFDGQRFTTFTRTHGLPADTISEIIDDTNGNLWLGTNNGIVRIDRQDIQGIRANAPVKFTGTIYDANDGLAGMPAHFGNPGVTRTRDGRLWFLTQSGIAIVNPSLKSPPRQALPVHVEAMIADDKPVDLSSAVVLPPRTRSLSFDYAAPDLSVPEKVQFRYMLEGFDNEWHDAGSRRQAFYNDLPPGPYRLRVVAGNNEGVWSAAGATTVFRVQPAFYQTIGFRTAAVVSLVLLGWALHRIRLWQHARAWRAQFEARAAERAHIATELHDTLIQDLSALSLSAEVADDQLPREPDAAKLTLSGLRTRLQEIVRKGRAGMTELRFGVAAAGDLSDALSRTAREFRERHSGAFHLVVHGQPRALQPLIGDEICRIAREAIGNAFLHANANRIDVELSFTDDELRVLVRDDGCGVTDAVVEGGRQGHLGMHVMRDRARRIGAKLQIWSRTNQGTEVMLVVPGRTAFEGAAADREDVVGVSSKAL